MSDQWGKPLSFDELPVVRAEREHEAIINDESPGLDPSNPVDASILKIAKQHEREQKQSSYKRRKNRKKVKDSLNLQGPPDLQAEDEYGQKAARELLRQVNSDPNAPRNKHMSQGLALGSESSYGWNERSLEDILPGVDVNERFEKEQEMESDSKGPLMRGLSRGWNKPGEDYMNLWEAFKSLRDKDLGGNDDVIAEMQAWSEKNNYPAAGKPVDWDKAFLSRLKAIPDLVSKIKSGEVGEIIDSMVEGAGEFIGGAGVADYGKDYASGILSAAETAATPIAGGMTKAASAGRLASKLGAYAGKRKSKYMDKLADAVEPNEKVIMEKKPYEVDIPGQKGFVSLGPEDMVEALDAYKRQKVPSHKDTAGRGQALDEDWMSRGEAKGDHSGAYIEDLQDFLTDWAEKNKRGKYQRARDPSKVTEYELETSYVTEPSEWMTKNRKRAIKELKGRSKRKKKADRARRIADFVDEPRKKGMGDVFDAAAAFGGMMSGGIGGGMVAGAASRIARPMLASKVRKYADRLEGYIGKMAPDEYHAAMGDTKVASAYAKRLRNEAPDAGRALDHKVKEIISTGQATGAAAYLMALNQLAEELESGEDMKGESLLLNRASHQ